MVIDVFCNPKGCLRRRCLTLVLAVMRLRNGEGLLWLEALVLVWPVVVLEGDI